LVCALGASLLLVFGALPASAAAETFVVNTTADGLPIPDEEACTGAVGINCTLREAIDAANSETGADTISFAGVGAGEVLEVEENSLPDIRDGVTIEGGTAADATPGEPALELVPVNFSGGTQFDPGLSVRAGEGTRIEGLAIGGFGVGIAVGPTDGGLPTDTEICGNYLGVELNGEVAHPNEVGVEVEGNPEERPEGTVIGSPGNGCPGNVLSGNTQYGVVDWGLETTIAGNSIGIGPQPFGEILPNGIPDSSTGGILEKTSAVGTMIGGTAPSGVEANFIAFNYGPGVFVEGWFSNVSIRHDSFVENEGLGIRILSDEKLEPPTIATAKSPAAGRIELAGTVNGQTDGEEVEMDFYGSPSCDPSGAGEGQTFLGSERFPIEAGSNPYGLTLFVGVPADDTAITATSTRAVGATTEFSQCATYEPPPPPEPEPEPEPTPEQKKAPDQGTPPAAPPVTSTVVPTNGETIVVKPEEGKVKIKLPGTNKYVPLEELKEIPVGAVIDATKGKVTLTSIDPDGTEQTASFFGGVFKVKQKEGSGLVVLELLDTGVCPARRPAPRAAASLFPGASTLLTARPGKATTGKLWGSGHGNFKTEGNQGAATVRGTIWLVEDRCNGTTFFKTRRGVVSIRDFVLHKTLSLPAGKSYVAGAG
jgi:CSLREA domain-containing protein